MRSWRAWLETHLQRAWYEDTDWLVLLYPLGGITSMVASFRLRRHLASRRKPPVPVVVVGNITVGGTGKTPVVAALAHEAIRRGLNPVILSRGYRARPPRLPWDVDPRGNAVENGDEPLLLAREAGIPVIIDRCRGRALEYALVHYHPDLVISDDGLQHYSLPRSVEIAVVDGHRGLGNERCIPAGPLREPRRRLELVDHVISNGIREGFADAVTMETRLLDPRPVTGGPPVPMKEFLARYPRINAVAGIGNPERFFAMLREQGFRVEARELPDHHVYESADLAFANSAPVVMTPKDAVKCGEIAETGCWYFPVQSRLPESFLEELFSHPGMHLQ